MHAVIIAAAAFFLNLSGIVSAVAPAFGTVGTIIGTTDKVVADTIGLRKYVAEKKALNAAKKLKPVQIPTKASK